MKYFSIIIAFIILASCDSPVQPEIIAVDGKEVSGTSDPILTHPELLTPLDSLTASFSSKSKTIEFSGTLFITFTVDKNGKVIEPQVIKGGNEQINKIAEEIIQSAKFKPGTQKGKPVAVKYGLPLRSTR